MKILENFDLTKLNSFGIKAKAKFFTEVRNESEFLKIFRDPRFTKEETLVLGGGSNVLFTRDFPGLVISNRMLGKEIVKEEGDNVWLRSMGGEDWHKLVLYAGDLGLWGIENLAFIPGTVGAAPTQNIGAYGVEIKDVLESVETIELETLKKKIFRSDECKYDYRDSIFKSELRGKYFVLSVTLLLSKKEKINLSYKVLADYIAEHKIEIKGPLDISTAVTAIRRSKLPDPKEIGNSGSFFKNVFVEKEKLEELQKKFGKVPSFMEEDKIKIPSAWLVETAGWKGYRRGDAGVHERQAIVLVNHGKATGAEIKKLSDDIVASVRDKFGIELSPEVNLI